jgi:DNA-binding transcriptional regulator YdaS (Cro superfamily)
MNALERAVEAAGGQSALARGIGGKIKQAHVWNWLNLAGGKVPAQHVISIEEFTGVSRHELRPDIFGAAPVDGNGSTERAGA